MFSLYNFSNEEYSLQGLINANAGLEKSIDEFINAASVSYTFDINTNFDIILTNSEFKEYSVTRATLWKHAENATTEKDYIGKQIGLIFIDFMFNKEYSLFLAYSFVEGSSCTDGYYGPAFGPTFNKVGWYIGEVSMENIPVGEIGYIKNSMPLVSINYSGKGFTSPQKPYRYVSRFVKPDDDICIWINTARIPKTDEEKSKGYNSICKPEDFNSEADIKLNEDLAFLFHCSDIMIVNEVQQYGNDSNTNTMRYGFNVMLQIEYAEGLHISHGGEDIFFDPNISEDDYYNWRDKYFKNPRP